MFDEVLDALINVGWQPHDQWLIGLRERDVQVPSQP